MRTLALQYPTVDALREDVTKNLLSKRAFVPGATSTEERERCSLRIVHPVTGDAVVLSAEVVWAAPAGVGLALLDLDAAARASLEALAAPSAPPAAEMPPPAEAAEDDVAPGSESPEARVARNVHERVRSLNARERDELARHGAMAERVALERAFGGMVWELLLQNPQLSVQEVARIARNGSLPRPLVSVIVQHSAWLASVDVQRALLSNPRCSGGELDRVLRAMKPSEVTQLSRQCPYRPEVRAAATRLKGR